MYKKIIVIFFFLNSTLYANDEYFLTLRYDKVHLRQGPSKDYPIKLFYKKKYLPVLIQDQSYNFRKIKDHENNSGWINISQLSPKKAAIVIKDNLLIFKKPTIYSKPLAVLEKGKLCRIKKCKDNWCKIEVNKINGWVEKDYLWGRL